MALRAVAFAGAATVFLAAQEARSADPTKAECVAATEAAILSAKEHKLRAQRAQLLTCISASCPVDVRNECISQLDAVNREIPTMIFGAKDGSGADLSAVKVTMDGEVLAERLEGTALSIDPGEHMFTFEAPGQPTVSKTLVIQQAQKDRREAITFGTPPAPIPPQVATQPAPQAAPTAIPPPPTLPGPAPAHSRVWPWWVGGVGIALGGTGIVLGAVEAYNQNQVNGNAVCRATPVRCSGAVSNDNVEEALAITAGAAGAVGIGMGIWGLATNSPPAPSTASAPWKVSPLLGPGIAGVLWKGGF
jgi:hypothetical protein